LSLNNIVLPNWWYLNSDLNLRSFSLPNFESHLLKVFKAFVAPYRKNILIQIIKFGITAAGNNPEHEGIIPIVFDYFVLKTDGDVKLFD
jgi:hypothetical protein